MKEIIYEKNCGCQKASADLSVRALKERYIIWYWHGITIKIIPDMYICKEKSDLNSKFSLEVLRARLSQKSERKTLLA
jgi:hypothetical protein